MIRLTEAVKKGVYNVSIELAEQTRYIGKLDITGEGTFTCNRTMNHVFKKFHESGSLGINAELLDKFNFDWIVIHFRDNNGNHLLITNKYTFTHKGRLHSWAGFEPQYFLPICEFGKDKAQQYQHQETCQLSMFGE